MIGADLLVGVVGAITLCALTTFLVGYRIGYSNGKKDAETNAIYKDSVDRVAKPRSKGTMWD